MAVEARHLNLFPSQLVTNRQVMNSVDANVNMYNAQQIAYSSYFPLSAAVTEAGLPSSVYNSLGNAVKTESGLTHNNSVVVPPLSRKRSRENNSYNDSFSFLGQDVSLQIQQQQLDIEHLIMQRMEKVRIEIDQKRKRQARKIIDAIEAGVIKKLKAKEEEIEKIGKLNWALEEKVKSLCMENQIWRDLAQTNEATANALRRNLEQVLAQRGMVDDGDAAALMDDAESCCGSTEEDGEGKKEVGWRTIRRGCASVKDKKEGGCGMIDESNERFCRNCGKEESCVLILPCRHLCLCTVCGSTLHICPICKSFKTASVHVNMS
ncbi:probable BOI-related E3 ubiquitin-protein ligase 3 [Vigna radiata var. radiata]|uniref:RING-type E3 ubiquitin transferase n=1 Tax=Vigna radiata var. radiata TaxID=3916 RepID=A0A1S3U1N9_VIGRR|nr:probable BOI-related E3 ubiquitin-protein ligase 3 [Vigna radiata var. radiata]